MSKILEDNKEDRDEAYKTQIAALEQQLSLSKDRYSRLEEECTERNTEIMDKNRELDSAKDRGSSVEKECAERNSEIVDKNRELDSAKAKETEQYTLIEQMQSRGEELEKETESKLEEGKNLSKTQETKKLRELVAERAKTTREYELRMKSLQEQLRHQTDRHHSEIQENQKRNDDRLQLKQELRIQEGDKAALLESEISILRQNYEETKTDYHACLKEAQQKSREAPSDFQRQDEVRQQEIDHMHDRLQVLPWKACAM
jgi:chromosome segregation ATPase